MFGLFTLIKILINYIWYKSKDIFTEYQQYHSKAIQINIHQFSFQKLNKNLHSDHQEIELKNEDSATSLDFRSRRYRQSSIEGRGLQRQKYFVQNFLPNRTN